ncbi:MAG: hypothetical protein H6622_10205 [Halobacteriovoraceae bacterium]|nr:hypothetical protein [Halobacteriovoraceae bacterium]
MRNKIITDYIKHFEVPIERQYTFCDECRVRFHFSMGDIIGENIYCSKCLDFMFKFKR